MKFNFSLRARQTDERYALVRTWAVDKQWELYEALLSASLYESFYDQPAEQLAALRKLIRDNEAIYVARLAVHFREQLHMRTLSFVLAAELSAICKDKELVGRLTGRVIQHAGEIPGWLDHYAHVHGSKRGKAVKMTAALRKHLAIHFNRLDTYRFVRLTKVQQARLKYALSLVQPKAAGKAQQALFRRIRQDKLPARNAWLSEYETVRQQNYDSREIRQSALRDKWKEGISSFRMGYAALLGNLPDILQTGISGKVLKLAAAYLGNEAAVTGSRQSPLRFVDAYRQLLQMPQGGAATLQEALEQAILHSAHYLACLDEHESTIIAMDISPSMRHPIKEGSLVQRYDIAPLLAMLMKSRGDKVTAGVIGNTWKTTPLPAYQLLGELERLHKREGEAGYALNAHLVIRDLLKKGEVVDKVMIFTDCQLWNQRSFNQPAEADLGRLWRQYRELAPNARLILFDLAGYGRKPLECLEDGVYLAAGWNEQVFGVLQALESEDTRTEMIEEIIV